MSEASNPSPLSGPGLQWHHSFGQLGARFYQTLAPSPLPAPYWVGSSSQVAQLLQLPQQWETSDHWLQALSGNLCLPGSQPLASVYSGHQFGVWAGQLGDGRALLLGELNGLEVQLKGAGPTPFSRMGDGRAVLRSSIREFLCSEAMHGLGIPTTRALSVTGSDAPVHRETTETAAVVTRVAPSFLRFGHMEHFAHTGQHDELKILADYVIDRFYPDCRLGVSLHAGASVPGTGHGNAYGALLEAVTRRTAELVAQWQAHGFCHGVLNTDNMSLLGLTLDYGPFQFLDAYDPAHICNHSDHQGRYAFHRQPDVAYWNLFCLGQALLPLIDDQAQALAALETYQAAYPQAFHRAMAAKLGFAKPAPALGPLVDSICKLLAQDRVDYSVFWRRLSHWAADPTARTHAAVRDLLLQREALDAWLQNYGDAIAAATQTDAPHSPGLMLRTNPKYVLRNHLAELAIRAAQAKDFSKVQELLVVLERPYEEHPALEHLAELPPHWASEIAISCSS